MTASVVQTIQPLVPLEPCPAPPLSQKTPPKAPRRRHRPRPRHLRRWGEPPRPRRISETSPHSSPKCPLSPRRRGSSRRDRTCIPVQRCPLHRQHRRFFSTRRSRPTRRRRRTGKGRARPRRRRRQRYLRSWRGRGVWSVSSGVQDALILAALSPLSLVVVLRELRRERDGGEERQAAKTRMGQDCCEARSC